MRRRPPSRLLIYCMYFGCGGFCAPGRDHCPRHAAERDKLKRLAHLKSLRPSYHKEPA